MKLIIIMRNLVITNCVTLRETLKLLCGVYKPIELSDGRDMSRTKNTEMGTPVWKPVLQCQHQTEGGWCMPVSFLAGIPLELNRENKEKGITM